MLTGHIVAMTSYVVANEGSHCTSWADWGRRRLIVGDKGWTDGPDGSFITLSVGLMGQRGRCLTANKYQMIYCI